MRTSISVLLIVCVGVVAAGCGQNTYHHHYSLEYPKMRFSTKTLSSSRFTSIPSHLDGFFTGYRIEGEEFTGYRNQAVTGRAVGEGIAEIYVRLTGEVCFLPDLPEAAVKELCGEGWQYETYDPRDGMQFQGMAIPKNYLSAKLTHYYYPAESQANHFTFMDGRLFSAEFRYQPDWLEISNSKEGPFLTFPIPDEDLISMFGKPSKKSKGTRQVRGCMDIF